MNVYTPSMRTILRLGAVALAMALGLSASEHHGQVKFGGLPMSGVSVTATKGDQKMVAVTDQQGVYAFTELPDGIWSFQIEMLCFEPLKQDVGIAPNAPSPQWELKLQSFDTIKASAPPPEPVAPVTTAGANGNGAAPAPTAVASAKPAATKGKGKGPAVPIPQQGGFQKTDVRAADGAKPAADTPPPPPPTSGDSAAPAPSDGFLINGSVNNGAASPFAQNAAFGNNRRGGRSLYNGNVGFQFGNSALDARSFSLTGQDTVKPAQNHLMGMASFGGPIKLPHGNPMRRPNFVINYQWARDRNANTVPSLMPDDFQRAGDFSRSVLASALIDPTTGNPFPGNIIPQGRISAQAQALLKLYPEPNFASSRYNYQIPLRSINDADNVQARLNKTINNKNSISTNGAFSRSSNSNPSLFGFTDHIGQQGINIGGSWVHRFTQRMFGTFTAGYNRGSNRMTPNFAFVRNIAGEAGITGNNQEPQNWGPPRLSFATGFAGLSDAEQSFTRNQTASVGYDMFWSHGPHNIRVGGDFRRQQFNLLSQSDPRGSFSFTGDSTGYDFADFLLGLPSTSSIAFGNADKYLRANSWDGYFTDDWRMSSGFTLNAGGRWEYNSPISERYGRLVNLDLFNGFAAAAPVIGFSPTGPLTGQRYPGSLVRPDKLGLEPRIGFAWHPILADSLTIRGGYGIYYDTSVYMSIAQRMIQQSPLSKSLTAQRSPGNPLTLANGFSNAVGGTTNNFAIDPNFQVGYAQNFQLSVQRDLPAGLMFTATYLGIKGTRARQESLPNTYPAGAVNPCPTCPSGFYYAMSNGNSTKHAGTFQIRRRLRAGLTATAQYTWSKAIDDAMLGGRGQGGSLVAQDWLNLSAERGLSNFDQRHAASFQAQYSSGVGLGGGALMSGWRGTLLKEWTLATQITVGSGLPQTPIYFSAIKGVTGSVRPLYTGASLYAAPPGLYLNPAAYAAPLPGQWGNAGRDTITGPGQFNMMGSLARSFRISERVNTDLRFDATNALNHVTYTSWNTTVRNAQFGLPQSANQMRTVKVNLRVRF
jgi:trimeric autotransporter adhesin